MIQKQLSCFLRDAEIEDQAEFVKLHHQLFEVPFGTYSCFSSSPFNSNSNQDYNKLFDEIEEMRKVA